MSWTFILLVTLSTLTQEVSVTCPEHQKPRGGSCYEVVGLRYTFPAPVPGVSSVADTWLVFPTRKRSFSFRGTLTPMRTSGSGHRAAPQKLHKILQVKVRGSNER
ncbi:unnamed protein product [Tetraodon nigroviridis]|uniref:(spotted green pufferfish) hypothetical protein n=1 Tax=Tetraodon nigroviridis TaxID=99883 RepID=Q4TIV7_TETNG|nr:unnamed protein product [Tetraodon nigroviridis]